MAVDALRASVCCALAVAVVDLQVSSALPAYPATWLAVSVAWLPARVQRADTDGGGGGYGGGSDNPTSERASERERERDDGRDGSIKQTEQVSYLTSSAVQLSLSEQYLPSVASKEGSLLASTVLLLLLATC